MNKVFIERIKEKSERNLRIICYNGQKRGLKLFLYLCILFLVGGVEKQKRRQNKEQNKDAGMAQR